MTPSSPFSGATVTGLSSPTYDYVSDIVPAGSGVSFAIDTLGGTQTSVTTHSVASPFTCSVLRPSVLKTLPPLNSVNGRLPRVPRNKYTVRTRKGMTVLSGQPVEVGNIETYLNVPAGADLADLPNLRAMISAHIGFLNDLSDSIATMAATGVV